MSERPEWFAPKRYGFGTGLPIAWQGWLVLVVFILVLLALTIMLSKRPAARVAAIVPILPLFVIVSARTTKGGVRWRWPRRDKN